jgi:hypothetical protein
MSAIVAPAASHCLKHERRKTKKLPHYELHEIGLEGGFKVFKEFLLKFRIREIVGCFGL